MAGHSFLRSGKLAELAGVSTDTLRYYERMKVLAAPRRSEGNYRMYPAEALDRVRLIRQALAMGFSIAELARIFRVRESGGAPCRQVRKLLEEKLEDIDRQLSELTSMRQQLRGVLADWDERLARTPDGKPAHLLESLLPGKGPQL